MNMNELENKAQANEQNDSQSREQGSTLSATESQPQLPDLEPRDEVKGGLINQKGALMNLGG